MIQPEETIIVSNKTFHVKQMFAYDGFKIQLELFKIIDLSKLTDNVGFLVSILMGLDVEKCMYLVDKLINNNDLVLNDQKKKFHMNEVFQGDYMGIYELLAKIILINYKDFFFDTASGRLNKLLEEIQLVMKPLVKPE
jgi:hypothetical protein